MRLSELQAPPGARHRRMRVGRGHGSGKVKTSGRGQKGQKARTGSSIPAYFEGGQLRLARRLPIFRGFSNPFHKDFAIVNVADLETWEGDEVVTPEALGARNLIRKNEAKGYVKILGSGDLTRKLTVQAHKFSASARAKIEAAGGTVIEIPIKMPVQTKRSKEGLAARKNAR
jgi:large subunit ribosomal protein L15